MKTLFHQTKQAFYFSLAFYLLAIASQIFHLPFAPIVISVSLLISLIWILLVLREVLLSRALTAVECVLLILFIIGGNILAGIVYFAFIREHVIGKKSNKK